jgi:hypothetical protein
MTTHVFTACEADVIVDTLALIDMTFVFMDKIVGDTKKH